MTRINLVDPYHLTDKHLMAEYRELPRVFTEVKKLTNKTEGLRLGTHWKKFIESNHISDKYKLGKGHVKFFYNKLPWLLERYKSICYELKVNRQVAINKDIYESVKKDAEVIISSVRFDMIEDWRPSPEEIYLNMARLCKRSKLEAVNDELREP